MVTSTVCSEKLHVEQNMEGQQTVHVYNIVMCQGRRPPPSLSLSHTRTQI